MNLYESPNLPQCISTVSLPISIVSLTVSSLYELYQRYKLYEPNELPLSLLRSYLSSRHKLYKLNELCELNELYPQPLARRYPSTDGRQLQPVNETARDAVRAEIGSRLVTEALGFPPELVATGPAARVTAAETGARTVHHGRQMGLPAPAKSNAVPKSKRPP
jgi:hypothetical protein